MHIGTLLSLAVILILPPYKHSFKYLLQCSDGLVEIGVVYFHIYINHISRISTTEAMGEVILAEHRWLTVLVSYAWCEVRAVYFD